MSAHQGKMFSSLEEVVSAHKQGEPVGIYSICSSNPLVLETALSQARLGEQLLLVESTSNQVNQFGGYTGMTPAEFRASLLEMANRIGFARERLILGGDHLGPNAWQHEPEATAMQKASELVAECVRAGYTKIHLDASMKLADDPAGPLAPEISARRATLLLQAAEQAWAGLPPGSPRPVYVVGSEVPPPGGAVGPDEELAVTPVTRARSFLEMTRHSFQQMGLEAAWERVIALVVQPGVEFGDESVHLYQREKATPLSRFIESVPGVVFEAHSTDYQTPLCLRQLVVDHFAILKVGPGLTFALREGLFALEQIEAELAGAWGIESPSNLRAVLEHVMLSEPENWRKYYSGTPVEEQLKRRYSLSDRIRYYWPHQKVEAAVSRLLNNLSGRRIPLGLVSQFFPQQSRKVIAGEMESRPLELVRDRIAGVIQDYVVACGWQPAAGAIAPRL